jgi:Glyoxalase-like domain
MVHYSRLQATCLDVPGSDLDRELGFWQQASGVRLSRNRDNPEYQHARWPGHDLALLVQRLGDGPPRVHLDLHTDDADAEVARLEGLGATRIAQVRHWWVLRDPAGLPFCVVPAAPGTLNAGNARRWG